MKISGEKWVIKMFMGEYHQKIDEKGRLTIPAKIRYELGDNFIVTRGLDGCLFVYKKETWEKIINHYQELPNVKEARNFMRFHLSNMLTYQKTLLLLVLVIDWKYGVVIDGINSSKIMKTISPKWLTTYFHKI